MRASILGKTGLNQFAVEKYAVRHRAVCGEWGRSRGLAYRTGLLPKCVVGVTDHCARCVAVTTLFRSAIEYAGEAAEAMVGDAKALR